MSANAAQRAIQNLPPREYHRATIAGVLGNANGDMVCPPGERWRVFSITVNYAADANASARNVRAVAVIGGIEGAGVETGVDIVANDTTLVVFGPGLPDSSVQKPATNGTIYVPMAEVIILPAEIIRVSATLGLVGDVFTAFASVEREFI